MLRYTKYYQAQKYLLLDLNYRFNFIIGLDLDSLIWHGRGPDVSCRSPCKKFKLNGMLLIIGIDVMHGDSVILGAHVAAAAAACAVAGIWGAGRSVLVNFSWATCNV